MPINLDNTTTQVIGLQPNILDSYYSYTYNISVRLYENSVLKTGQLPQSTDKFVTIVETGVTGQFYIKRLEVNSIVGVLSETRGITTQSISLDIDEPLGFSFIDRMLLAGIDLGLPQLNGAPCLITVTFTGWDPSGNSVGPIGQPKQILCTLQMVTPDFSKKGTMYHITFIPLNNLPQQNNRMEIPKMISFNKADTLLGTLSNFATELNKVFDVASEQTNQTISGSKNDPNRLRQTWSFLTQDGNTANSKISTWTMDKNKQQGGDQTATANTPVSSTMPTDTSASLNSVIVAHPGTHIADVLTSILANTNEAYIFTCPAATPQTAKLIGDDFPGFFTYETTYTTTAYDPNTGSYLENLSITIIPKVIQSNSFVTLQPGDSTAIQKLISENLLVKGYEYIFTGENTSILDLKMDLSTLWKDSMQLFTAALRDRHATIIPSFSTSPIRDTPPTMQTVPNAASPQSTNQLTPFQQNATKLDNTSITTGVQTIPGTPSAANNIFQNTLSTNPNYSITGVASLPPNSITTNVTQNNTFNITNSTEVSNTISSMTNAQSSSILPYLEDYSTKALNLESFSAQEPSRNYSRTEQMVRGYSAVGSPASNAKISIFGYMADVSFTSIQGTLNSMLNVSLIIRGDPYWLGITPQEAGSLYQGQSYTDIRLSQSDFASYQSGQQNIYLKFRTPQGIDNNTGLMIINDSSSFNRVYTVQSVKHIFENGSFKQELSLLLNKGITHDAAESTLTPLLPSAGGQTMGATGTISGVQGVNGPMDIPNSANNIFQNTLSTNPNIATTGVAMLSTNSITTPNVTGNLNTNTNLPSNNGIITSGVETLPTITLGQ